MNLRSGHARTGGREATTELIRRIDYKYAAKLLAHPFAVFHVFV